MDPPFGDEVFLCSQVGVGLYEKELKTVHQVGKLSLSTHRFLYASESTGDRLFIRLDHFQKDKISNTTGMAWSHPKIILHLENGSTYYKFSFRSGGCQTVLHHLKRVMASPLPQEKVLVVVDIPPVDAPLVTEQAGISRCVLMKPKKEVEESALADIQSLMQNAGSIVEAIQRLKGQVQLGGTTAEDSKALLSVERALGLGNIVTTATIGEGAKFHKELSVELASWLAHSQNTLGRAPFVPLIQLFSQYNRARGSELLSPGDLLTCCKFVSSAPSSPYTLRTFRSGFMALQKGDGGSLHALPLLLGPQPKQLADLSSGLRRVSSIELAKELNLGQQCALELLEELELEEVVCRSEDAFGIPSFYWNVFLLK